MKKPKTVARLAFRVEGDKWTCYAAKPDTMEGARFMGCIMMGIANDPHRKAMFMELMKDAFGDFIEEYFGASPTSWETHDAPESERSGSA